MVREVAAHHQGSRLAGAPIRRAVPAAGGAPRAVRRRRAPDRQHRRAARAHRPRPGRRHRAAAGLRRDVRRPPGAGRRRRGDRRGAQGRAGLSRGAGRGRHPGRLLRRPRHLLLAGGARTGSCLLEALRAAAPLRAGARGGDHDVLRRDRRRACTPVATTSPTAIGQTLRTWADHLRARGVAAVFEAAQVAGMAERVLAWRGGEREMTDLAHLAQLLHETAHRERLGLPALLDWLREECSGRRPFAERTRRLDSDAAAVQIMTVWVSKGLQYPVVYLPFGFNRHVFERRAAALPRGRRPLPRHRRQGAQRARSQPDALAGRGRRRRHPADLRRADPRAVAGGRLVGAVVGRGQRRHLPVAARPQAARRGGPGQPRPGARRRRGADLVPPLGAGRRPGRRGVGGRPSSAAPMPPELPVGAGRAVVLPRGRRRLATHLLLRADPRPPTSSPVGVASEPEDTGLEDEAVEPVPTRGEAAAARRPAVAHGRPAGRRHLRLTGARRARGGRPARARPAAELPARAREQLGFWPVDVTPGVLAEAMLPLHATPLGPLVPGLTLGDLGLGDRLRELDFEIPLAGGDHAVARRRTPGRRGAAAARPPGRRRPAARVRRPARAAAARRPVAARLSLRVDRRRAAGARTATASASWSSTTRPTGSGTPSGRRPPPTTRPDRLAAAMLHSDYPLQALLYSVVVHRYLRWRLPGVRPRDPPRRCASTSTCAACAGRTPRSSTGTRPGCSAGRSRPRWCSRCLPSRREDADDDDRRRGPSTARSRSARPGCCVTSTRPACSTAADVHVARPARPTSLGETDES